MAASRRFFTDRWPWKQRGQERWFWNQDKYWHAAGEGGGQEEFCTSAAKGRLLKQSQSSGEVGGASLCGPSSTAGKKGGVPRHSDMPSSLCSVLTTDLSEESLWGEGSGGGSGRVITCTPPPRCSERARLRTDSCLCLRTLRRWTPSCGTLRTKDSTVSLRLLNQEHKLLINDFI